MADNSQNLNIAIANERKNGNVNATHVNAEQVLQNNCKTYTHVYSYVYKVVQDWEIKEGRSDIDINNFYKHGIK